MTKEEKRAQEAKLPLTERNYWHLSKSEKSLWLSKKGLNKFQDITIPILTPIIGLLGMALGLFFLIAAAGSTSGLFATKKGLWMAAGGVVAAIGLGVAIWLLIDMKKKHKGFFINQYYAGDKSVTERAHEEISSDRIADSNQDMETGHSELDELDL